MVSSLSPYIGSGLRLLTDVLWPPQCAICRAQISRHGALCQTCWSTVSFISPPFCGLCGRPFSHAMPEVGALCGACLAHSPPWRMGRSVFAYEALSKRLILSLKYHDQTSLVPTLAHWMTSAGRDVLADADLLVPVPMPYRRYLRRRFNQAALLAQAVSARTGIPCLPDALTRIKPTEPQSRLRHRARQLNVKGAFAATPRAVERLKGRLVVLVDDVATSGATLRECTKALLAAEASGVNVLTLAVRI